MSLQQIFSQLMERHSSEVKAFMVNRPTYEIAQQVGAAWGPPKVDIGQRGHNVAIGPDRAPIVWLYAGKMDTAKDVAIFIDEHIENHPALVFSSDWSDGAEPDLMYRLKSKKGQKIRFIFSLAYSENCELVETVEARTVYKRVCK